MSTQRKLRIFITKACGDKANDLLGDGGKEFLISYAAEQWQLENVSVERNGRSFLEMPRRSKVRELAIWVSELDGNPKSLVLLDIGPRKNDKRDGFAQYVAEVCGRFVGGIVASLGN